MTRNLTTLVLLTAAAALAQQDSGVTLRSETRLVEINVSVRDSSGKPVDDLIQSEFTLTDNGRPRAFTIFSVNRAGQSEEAIASASASVPLRPALPAGEFTNLGGSAPPPEGHSTVILLDAVNGWFESFVWGRKGVQGLMDKLPPDERIAVYVISLNQGLLQLVDYTTNRELVKNALATFIPRGMTPGPPGMGPNGDGAGMMDSPAPGSRAVSMRRGPDAPPPNPLTADPRDVEYQLQRGSEQARYSLAALADRLRSVPGRKSVFWITQGFPPRQLRDAWQPAWEKTVSALNDANIAVNTVDTDGLGGPPRRWGPGGILMMQQIAADTGGKAYFHRNDLNAALAEGVVASRSSYTLGFYLSDLDGKYHELKVRANRSGLQLSHRLGYYAQTEAMHDMAGRKTELESVLLNPLGLTGLGITAGVETKAGTLELKLQVDPSGLSLKPDPRGWTGKVELLLVEQTDTGYQLAKISQTAKFSVETAAKAEYDKQGPLLSPSIRLMPGAARLWIIARDPASGRTGSLIIPLK